jgi:hypothetical protein
MRDMDALFTALEEYEDMTIESLNVRALVGW